MYWRLTELSANSFLMMVRGMCDERMTVEMIEVLTVVMCWDDLYPPLFRRDYKKYQIEFDTNKNSTHTYQKRQTRC